MNSYFRKLVFIFVLPFLFAGIVPAQNNDNQGVELYRQGEYEKAVEILQAAVKADKNDRLSWTYLGASLIKLKKDNEAGKAFRKANSARPKSAPAYIYDKELKITDRPRPVYSAAARQNQTGGVVRLAVEFREDGKIGFVFPFQMLSDGLTESVVQAVKNYKFEPAVRAGKPVAVIRFIEYSFSF